MDLSNEVYGWDSLGSNPINPCDGQVGRGIVGCDPLQGMTRVEDGKATVVLAHESGERARIRGSRVTPVYRSSAVDGWFE